METVLPSEHVRRSSCTSLSFYCNTVTRVFVLFFYTPRRASVCLAFVRCPRHPSAAVLTFLKEVYCFHEAFETNTGKSYSINRPVGVQVVEAPRISRQFTAVRTGRLYPQQISTYVGEWPLPVDASTDTLYFVISNRLRGCIGPSTCVEMTFTGTNIIAFIFCSESLVLQVQNRYGLYFRKSTSMAGWDRLSL